MSNWLDEAFIQLKKRNERQVDPYKEIQKDYDELFERYLIVEKSRIISRHRIILLEHEFHEAISKRDLKLAVDRFKKGIQAAQQDLLPPQLSPCPDQPPLNLSKDIYEKNKIIQKQSEDILTLKSLSENQELALNLTKSQIEQLQASVNEKDTQLNELRTMMSSMEDLIKDLKKDKEELTARLISEKEKAASQINEMNAMLEGSY